MAQNKKITDKKPLLLIIIISFLFFLPFLANPDYLAIKDNDLGRTYIPIINFVKHSLFEDRSIPLWRPDQMMGEPFIGNAVFSLVYPLNIIFLIFPTNFAAVLFYLTHFILAAIFTFYLARSFYMSKISSVAAALFYAFSTKMMVQTSAGHITMVAAFSFFPIAFLATRKILTGVDFIWVIVLSVSLASIFILYQTVFYYSALFLIFYVTYYLSTHFKVFHLTRKKVCYVATSFLFAFGLSAIQLFPQLEFGPLSTRSQLKVDEAAFPLWNLKRFLTSLLFPHFDFQNFDHESILYLGFVPMILALLGFLNLPKLKKIVLIVGVSLTLSFVAGLS